MYCCALFRIDGVGLNNAFILILMWCVLQLNFQLCAKFNAKSLVVFENGSDTFSLFFSHLFVWQHCYLFMNKTESIRLCGWLSKYFSLDRNGGPIKPTTVLLLVRLKKTSSCLFSHPHIYFVDVVQNKFRPEEEPLFCCVCCLTYYLWLELPVRMPANLIFQANESLTDTFTMAIFMFQTTRWGWWWQ